MAKLTTAKRKGLPASSFAGPGRSYPIPDASHARNALARASGKPVDAEIKAKVHKKFPGIGKGYANGAPSIPAPGQTTTNGSWEAPTTTTPPPVSPSTPNANLRRQIFGPKAMNKGADCVGGYRDGNARVPGKPPMNPQKDSVPAMLQPGEAVVNREGVKRLPGGRPAIAMANKAGLADRAKMAEGGMVRRRGYADGSTNTPTPTPKPAAHMCGMERAMTQMANKMHPVKRR